MPKVRYSNKAVEDRSSIWEQTFSEWSENQADEHYEMLLSVCNRLLYPQNNLISSALMPGIFCFMISYIARKSKFSQPFVDLLRLTNETALKRGN